MNGYRRMPEKGKLTPTSGPNAVVSDWRVMTIRLGARFGATAARDTEAVPGGKSRNTD